MISGVVHEREESLMKKVQDQGGERRRWVRQGALDLSVWSAELAPGRRLRVGWRKISASGEIIGERAEEKARAEVSFARAMGRAWTFVRVMATQEESVSAMFDQELVARLVARWFRGQWLARWFRGQLVGEVVPGPAGWRGGSGVSCWSAPARVGRYAVASCVVPPRGPAAREGCSRFFIKSARPSRAVPVPADITWASPRWSTMRELAQAVRAGARSVKNLERPEPRTGRKARHGQCPTTGSAAGPVGQRLRAGEVVLEPDGS
jgi:hypothetical protein